MLSITSAPVLLKCSALLGLWENTNSLDNVQLHQLHVNKNHVYNILCIDTHTHTPTHYHHHPIYYIILISFHQITEYGI
jgi:hypothetical protein